MLPHLTAQLNTFQSTPGLIGIRVVQAAENRMVLTADYEDKRATYTNGRGIHDGLSVFVTKEPIVREGDVDWRYEVEGKENLIMPGYARHIAVGYDPSKFDAMVSYADSQVDVYQSLDGLRRILVVPVSGSEGHPRLRQEIGNLENRMIVTAGYDIREASQTAREKANAFWSGMAEFLTDAPRILEDEFVYGFRR